MRDVSLALITFAFRLLQWCARQGSFVGQKKHIHIYTWYVLTKVKWGKERFNAWTTIQTISRLALCLPKRRRTS